ncbi:glycosyltransferase family 2 protein [Planctomycetota bacterium]
MSSDTEPPLVSIGLPAYNRPHFLQQTLESLTQQTYQNLEIIVSDDCSPGEATKTVIQEFVSRDSRIRPFRQSENLRPVRNSIFTLRQATGKYFFWAGEDDLWDKRFFETGVASLEDNPSFHAWKSAMVSIDSYGRVVRNYPPCSWMTSTADKRKDLVKYLRDPEINGKANTYHSIFLRTALVEALTYYHIDNRNWGADCCFVLAFLARFNLMASDEVLFYKRMVRPTDSPTRVDVITIKNPSRHIFSLKKCRRYIRENCKAVKGTPYERLVLVTLILRLPTAMRNYLLKRLRVFNVVRAIRKRKRNRAGRD